MSTVNVDSRGRVYIPKEMREEFGDKLKIIKTDSGIKLIPLDDDPVKGLSKAMQGAEEIELDELDQSVEEKARKEVKDDI
jgi:AbrB family looped-hinge helix DNA binding protein